MLITLALCLALQETETIPRNHLVPYQIALLEYERAVGMIDSDPKQALQIIERIFENKKIEKKDRKVLIERAGMQGGYKVYDFYPNQTRGRIRQALARSDPDNASGLLAAAVVDLKASVDAGVKTSERLLEDARKNLERIKTVKTPEPPKESAAEQAFREAWLKLVDDRKFKSARDFVDAKGAALSAEKRRDYVRDTEERCRKSVLVTLDEFLKALELSRMLVLRQMRPMEFNRQFALPSETELVGSYAELDWARKERPLLEKLRQTDSRPREDDVAPLMEALIAQTLATEAFDRTGENRWFKASGQLTLRYAEDVVQALVLMSKDASSEKRQRCREAAEKIRSKWSETLAKLPKEFVSRNQLSENPRRLAMLLDEFPVDAAEVDHLDLEACFSSESPDSALEHVISDLTKIRDQQGARLSKESMRKLLTDLVVATAAQEFLAGKGSEEVAKSLQELGRSLSQAGGPFEASHWGPKLEKIFAAIK